MTMDSPRADLDMVIGYDLGDEGFDYTAVTVMKRNADGSVEVLASLTTPGEHIPRGQLLTLCCASIVERRPKTVRVQIGKNPPVMLNHRTVEEILAGLKTVMDLMIGS